MTIAEQDKKILESARQRVLSFVGSANAADDRYKGYLKGGPFVRMLLGCCLLMGVAICVGSLGFGFGIDDLVGPDGAMRPSAYGLPVAFTDTLYAFLWSLAEGALTMFGSLGAYAAFTRRRARSKTGAALSLSAEQAGRAIEREIQAIEKEQGILTVLLPRYIGDSILYRRDLAQDDDKMLRTLACRAGKACRLVGHIDTALSEIEERITNERFERRLEAAAQA